MAGLEDYMDVLNSCTTPEFWMIYSLTVTSMF